LAVALGTALISAAVARMFIETSAMS